MRRALIPELTYLRGLCMLGVIAIHIGAVSLSNPDVNVHLIGFLEILSRWTVPAFFFLSAFGLFYHTPVTEPLSYGTFLRRRIGVVAIPYVVWSLLYLFYASATTGQWGGWLPRYLGPTLFFGTAYYHLYFMVILLWFYVMMPVWRYLVKAMLPHPVRWLTIGFILQLLVNYWSSYDAGLVHFNQHWLQYAFSMRLNYWVIHYVWVFLLGGVLASYAEDVPALLWNYRMTIIGIFILATAAMLGAYYYVMDHWHYTMLEAIYTVHQLSPMGMVYTGASLFFFYLVCLTSPMTTGVRATLQVLGDTSYGMYLVHPFILIVLTAVVTVFHGTYVTPVIISLYIGTVCISMGVTLLLQRLPKSIRSWLLGK